MRVFALMLIGVLAASAIVYGMWPSLHRWIEMRQFLQAYDSADQTAKEFVAERFLSLLSSRDMIAALEKRDPLCHSEAHPLGKEIYRETQNLPRSLAMCGSGCSYGCFHGVLMQMFSSESDNFGGAVTGISDADVFSEIIRSVPTFCAQREVQSVVTPWICLHGIGHVIMYLSHYDIAHALSVCEELPNATETSICAGGAFMEYIRSEDNAPAISQQNFFPCDQYPGFAKPCFVYKGQPMVRAFGSTDAALDACASLEPVDERTSCIRGVGVGGTSLEMLKRPGGLDPVCGSLVGRELMACIDGAVSSIVFRMEADKPACPSLASPYDQYCAQEINHMKNLVLEQSSI